MASGTVFSGVLSDFKVYLVCDAPFKRDVVTSIDKRYPYFGILIGIPAKNNGNWWMGEACKH